MTRPISVGAVLRTPKTAELIADQIRSRIVHGQLHTGDALPHENELIEHFGVSRPTLREAFRILETESLVQVRRGAHGGARVTAPEVSVAAGYVGVLLQLNATTVGDVYQACAVIEPACAALFAGRRTKAEVDELRSVADAVRLGTATSLDDADAMARLTHRAHALVLLGSGNNTLVLQGRVLQDIIAKHVATVLVAEPSLAIKQERFRSLVSSYYRMAELLDAADAGGAEQHWRNHMTAAGRHLLGESGHRQVVELLT